MSSESNSQLVSLEGLGAAAECFKILAHPHRLHILQLLETGAFTVGELAEACEIASHMASEHLKLMARCGFLESDKEGRKTYYRISEPHLHNLLDCVRAKFGSN